MDHQCNQWTSWSESTCACSGVDRIGGPVGVCLLKSGHRTKHCHPWFLQVRMEWNNLESGYSTVTMTVTLESDSRLHIFHHFPILSKTGPMGKCNSHQPPSTPWVVGRYLEQVTVISGSVSGFFGCMFVLPRSVSSSKCFVEPVHQ